MYKKYKFFRKEFFWGIFLAFNKLYKQEVSHIHKLKRISRILYLKFSFKINWFKRSSYSLNLSASFFWKKSIVLILYIIIFSKNSSSKIFIKVFSSVLKLLKLESSSSLLYFNFLKEYSTFFFFFGKKIFSLLSWDKELLSLSSTRS